MLVGTDWLRLKMVRLLYFKVDINFFWAMGPGWDDIMNAVVT
jgi:hypothetical protein